MEIGTMNGFDDFDTQVTAEEFYAGWTEDEADYLASRGEELEQVESILPDTVEVLEDVFGAAFESFLSRYDDDPSPYTGTYSEE
jgi:hypothetical protein